MEKNREKPQVKVVCIFVPLMAMLIIACKSITPKTRTGDNIAKILTADSVKYWDRIPKGGMGWCFMKNGNFFEYDYNKNGRRIENDYDDIIIDTIKWSVRNDTLRELIDYKINKISEDSLEVSYSFIWEGNERGQKLKFCKSDDQKTKIRLNVRPLRYSPPR